VRIPEPTALLTRDVRPLPEDREMNRRITYDNLYGDDRVSLGGSPTRVSRWVDDDHFLQRKEGDLFKVHAGTGRGEKVSFDPSDIAAKLAELPALTKRDATQIARRWFNNPVPPEAEEDGRVRPIVFEFADDLYAAMPDGTEAKRLTSTPEDEDLWELSPDGRWVGFVRDFNLYVVDIATAGERAITTGGHDELRYGRHDWVYFEELYGRSWKAWWWGPDSRHLAFFETASDMMPSFTIVDDGPEPQRIETVRYPKPGQANPQVKVHVAKVSGARPTEVDLGWYDDGAYLVSGLSWRPDGSEVRVIVQNRQQTWLDVLAAKTSSGATRRLFRDQTEAWIEPNGGVVDLDAGGFLWRSERDGYLHVYRYDDDGELLGRLTEGPFEVDRIVRVDEENGFLYFTSELDSPIGSHFYRVAIGEPDDEGSVTPSEPQRLTPDRGTHFVSLSPDATKFVDSWSSTEQPTMVALRSTNGGVAMRWLDTNPVYELEEFDLGRTELVAIPSEKFDHNGDPIEFEGVIVYPPDFDPSKTYPVWFRTYGGPHAPTVRDSWSGGRLFEQMLAAEGIVVFRGDPYPASGKGVVSTWSAYRNLGIREVEDVAEMIEWITANGWADASRVGMDGWSYGGFMTLACMLRTDLFSAGISGAPPTNWRDYDTIYTERYMDTPQNNPDGYEATDLVKLAEDLHGELLLIHGMMDDNVHMQNSVRMIDALQDAGKNFEFMMYPGARHGVRSRHRNLLYFNFVTRTMLGDREESEPESLADEIESPVGP
ncbi:MAG: DPP IV N-terminal domain-containing protein, partial [Planctomycetota bacterium]